jgi:hypothetical protein
MKSGICKSSEGLHLWNSAAGSGLDPVNGVQAHLLAKKGQRVYLRAGYIPIDTVDFLVPAADGKPASPISALLVK